MKDYDLLEVVPVAMFVHDATQIRFANAEARRLLKIDSPEQIVGRPFQEFVHVDSHDAGVERRKLLFEHNHSLRSVDAKLMARDGNPVHVRGDATTVVINNETLVVISCCEVPAAVPRMPSSSDR